MRSPNAAPLLLLAAFVALGPGACLDKPAAEFAAEAETRAPGAAGTLPTPELRPRANPSEFTGIQTEKAVTAEQAVDLLSRLVGPDAEAGRHVQGFELAPGLLLHSLADPNTPEQVVLVVEMDAPDGVSPAARTLATVPASLQYGAVVVDTARAAIALWERDPETYARQPVVLEYRLHSPLGGALTLALRTTDDGLRLGATVQTPRTSLLPDRVNEPYFTGPPVESIYGLVTFQLTRDQFDFFATRAYGITAGAAQNFQDFWLLPHEWLRLTVEPRLDDSLVDVQFEVVTVDDRRIPLSRAPASLLAGEQFMQNVFRMVDNMNAAEKNAPGSSSDWAVPFYYDDPDGGGVVEVIAMGRSGVFQIAYAVETPINPLQDTEFVAYQGTIDIPDDWDAVDPACAEIGSTEAAQGHLVITFDASSTVRRSAPDALRGDVRGSVYRDQDVRITGPIDDARPAASFHFEDVDISDSGNLPSFRLDTQLPAGKYQILGYIAVQPRSADDDPDSPVRGDPVMIPIGAFELRCAEQPVVAEFAINYPGR